MTENFRDKLIFSKHADGTFIRGGSEPVSRNELNNTEATNHKGPRPESYSVKDYINSIRRGKGLPEIE